MAFFAAVSTTAFFVCLIIRTSMSDFNELKVSDLIKKQSAVDWLMLAFLFAGTVSWLISDYRSSALIGASGRYMGFLMIIAMVCAYFFIAKFYVIKERDFLAFAVVFAVVAAVGVLEFIGFDPFGLMEATPDKYRNSFLSFLGNLNVYSSFMCVGTPFAMYSFLSEKKLSKSAFWLAVSSIGFLGLFICNSDGGYIGMGVAFIVCGYLALKNAKELKKYFGLIAAFFISGKGIWLYYLYTSRETRSFSHMTQLFISKNYTYYIIIASLILCAAVWLIRKLLSDKMLKALRVVYVSLVVLAFAGAVSTIIYFTFFDLKTELGKFEYLLRFNDDWGTFRGTVWRWTLSAYADYPFINKLFGAGEDTLALVLSPIFSQEMAQTGLNFDNAHNEFLHYLATIGIVGAGSYIAALVICAVKLLRGNDSFRLAAGVVILAFAAQSFINILQPITSPFIFVFIALMQARRQSYEEPATAK